MNTPRARFLAEYHAQLVGAGANLALSLPIMKYPNEYCWHVPEPERVFSRMALALIHGSYNKDSHAIEATCKALGIAHTYEAINQFIAE